MLKEDFPIQNFKKNQLNNWDFNLEVNSAIVKELNLEISLASKPHSTGSIAAYHRDVILTKILFDLR